MQLAKRNIRSSGRNSGSIEITLPVELAVLEGVPCQVGLRDGLLPEIVLQPDLCDIVPVFETLWDRLGLGLENVGAIGDFAEADYALGLFPEAKWAVRPSLAYADGLLIRRSCEVELDVGSRALEAFARLVESMMAVAGGRLGLSDGLAVLFGNQVAYLLSGGAITARDAFMGGFASHAIASPFAAGGSRAKLLSAAPWRDAQPELARLYDQFATWDDEPESLAKTREHWYRARRFEARVAMTRT